MARLLPHDVVATWDGAKQTRAVPENPINDGVVSGITPGKEDLEAVARPFGGVAGLFRWT